MTNITNIDRTPFVPPQGDTDDPCDYWSDVPSTPYAQTRPVHIVVEPAPVSVASVIVTVISWMILGGCLVAAFAL